MQLTVISPGKTKKEYLAAAITDFQKRLSIFLPCRMIYTREVAARAKTPVRQIMELEGRRLLEKIQRPTLLVALDRTGKQFSSEELAELLEKWEGEGRRSITFLIGGHLGLSEQVVDKANVLLSLSKMTFTHEIARLILLEQLYRASTIRKGTGYHK
ncbi:MAG: 23S rRNA (pseudouridine(1915)-N(3))-methyltransferase RlmH [Deltaproteobacteria bacterium]